MRNAYVLIYKRKLTDESLIVRDEDHTTVQVDGQASSQISTGPTNHQLGSMTMQLDSDNPLNQRIQWDNHRYWHIRFLFREDYQTFVTNVLKFWHTENIIPAKVSWRNQDFHLLDPKFANLEQAAKVPMVIEPPTDVSLNLRT